MGFFGPGFFGILPVHDSPLLHILGVGVETYRVDLLHVWHLGPLGLLVAECIWFCIRCRVFVPKTLLYFGLGRIECTLNAANQERVDDLLLHSTSD